MKTYKIFYKQGRDSEIEHSIYRGYDADHAIERFLDSMEEEGGSEGVEVVNVYRVEIQNGIVRLV